jgi:ADP-glucose pyrophosphorylase
MSPLTRRQAKPMIPFGGIYHLIDITLSNCLNSGLNKIYVMTQYKALSLYRHLRETWNILPPELNQFIEAIPPMQRIRDTWYLGTADAVYQNIQSIEDEGAGLVLILSADHNFRHFTHGYAVTAHRSQGKTVDAVIISADGMRKELFYVAASRGRERALVITSNKEQLLQSSGRSAARQSATEFERRLRPGLHQGICRGLAAARRLAMWAAQHFVPSLSRNLERHQQIIPRRKERSYDFGMER